VFPASSIENILRALATLPILAELRIDDEAGSSSNASGGGSIPAPMASWPFPNLLKLPGLFGDLTLTTSGPKP
jgi:hypothetical protein